MNIPQKLQMDVYGLIEHGAVTIVVFGDSVTHGAVAPNEIDYETVYWNRLRKMLQKDRDYVPVNVINAGIGGVCARTSICRVQRDIISHHPDVAIICFGLNDINEPLESYIASLKTIFEQCLAAQIDTIFMTPNMLNTYVAEDTIDEHLDYAAVTAGYQTSGKMDQYMESACQLATEMGVTVCDCYGQWKKLESEGTDTTLLLANRINHPTKQMHQLFADMLYQIIMGQDAVASTASTNTMYVAADK